MIDDTKLNRSLFLIQLIASFLVVAGHYTADASYYSQDKWYIILNQLSRYGTVLLAMITGYFTAKTFTEKQPTFLSYFSGKLKYIIIPYFFAGILYHWLLKKEFPHTLDAYFNILLGKTGAHLYFVFMLIQYYLFAYFFRKLITKRTILFLILPFLGLQYLYIQYWHQGWLELTHRHILFTWIFTLYVGHLLYWYRDKIVQALLKHASLLVICTSIASVSCVYFALSTRIFAAQHISFVLATFLTLLIGIAFFYNIEQWIKVRFYKGLTYYIYLFHSAVLILLNKLLINFPPTLIKIFTNVHFSVLYLLIIYSLTLILSISIVKLQRLFEQKKRMKGIQSVQADAHKL